MLPTQFFDLIQKKCLPGIWSKGVNLARTASVIVDSQTSEELILRVRTSDRPVSPKVTLWPEDEDWHCDCQHRNEICPHVAASIIALKNGTVENNKIDGASSPSSSQKTLSTQLLYHLKRAPDGHSRTDSQNLVLERWLIRKDSPNQKLTESLVSLIGGIQSGRVTLPPLAVTQDDFAIDALLTHSPLPILDSQTLLKLFKILSHQPSVQFENAAIQVSANPIHIQACLVDENEGFRLKQEVDSPITESFKNGAALSDSIIRAVMVPDLTLRESEILRGNGRHFSFHECLILVTEILPALEKKMPVIVHSKRLPQTRKVPPKIILQFKEIANQSDQTDVLFVTPVLRYEDPSNSEQSFPSVHDLFIPDPVAEKILIRKLQNELQLNIGQTVAFSGDAAVDFILRTQTWEKSGNHIPKIQDSLIPQFLTIHQNDRNFECSFQTSITGQKVGFDQVFRAWRENRNYVPLLGGGWAPLPNNWLETYGERVLALLEAKENSNNELPAYRLPELASLYQETQQPHSDFLKNLRHLLDHLEDLKEVKPPTDLNVKLRHYQQQGLNWLCFLKKMKMGALLADDMGLGKTLQTLCAIEGRTLIVAPTSVLYHWAQQIEQFRPSLSFSIYYGSSRTLDLQADIIITTYALLRINRDLLTQENWKTVVLDEAQIIKNPESQIAQSAHQLRADFKIALSGTPIQNNLVDLWSQFQFLNPGLLGSLSTFKDTFETQSENAKTLRERVKPFILRRLKKDVIPELPPKTETTLYCELAPEERLAYDSLLASTRHEVLASLDAKKGVFAALELILRLRQACCHSALIPGSNLAQPMSSKIELLLQTLENVIALGHRVLIFSQWTSYLDWIEKSLNQQKISFLRLDGKTQNRQEKIEEFQNNPNISVMLLSLKAGGVGLTLTAADHIFLMDPWWNPSVEDQATDRAHRLGQVNPVFVHRLIAKDTIEEKILLLQKTKISLASNVLEDTATASMTREDILALLN